MDRRLIPLATVVVAVILVFAALTAGTGNRGLSIGGAFTLVDDSGHTVSDTDFRGRFLLVFFGYTYCPDVCPTELQVMADALRQLGPTGDRVQPLFITVDPERDTVSHLHDYVALFPPRLIGLTGTPEQVAAAARAYRVYYRRVPTADGGYSMDHSGLIYLMGPDGRFITAFTPGSTAQAIADSLRR
jgi:protein SCO1/2